MRHIFAFELDEEPNLSSSEIISSQANKRYSEFLGGPGKRYSEFLGGPGKRSQGRYADKRFGAASPSFFLAKKLSEFLGGPGKRWNMENPVYEYRGYPRGSEFLGGPGKR